MPSPDKPSRAQPQLTVTFFLLYRFHQGGKERRESGRRHVFVGTDENEALFENEKKGLLLITPGSHTPGHLSTAVKGL